MCRCIYEMQDNLKEKFGYESVSAPVEILSGRAYLSFTVKEQGKKKEKEIPLMLSKCPFCGEKYEIKN